MYPTMWISLARNLIPELSPLVRQIDFALDWMHINSGIYQTKEHVNLTTVARTHALFQG